MAALALAGPPAAGAAVGSADDPPEQRIVVFDGRAPEAGRLRALAELDVQVVRELSLIDAAVVRLPPLAAQAAEARLKSLPGVERVDDDPVIDWLKAVEAAPWPSVESWVDRLRARRGPPPQPPRPETDPEIPWGVARVNAPAAWKLGRGAGVKVAVLDSGISPRHPDLAANLAGGFNAIEPGKPFDDDNGHGTHVAGTIAALRNGRGVAGVAPEARLYAVKVTDKNGKGRVSDGVAALEWAVANRVQIVNMSIGTREDNPSFREAVRRTGAAGIAMIGAAGNDLGKVSYPAAYPEVIAVSASDASDDWAWFSNSGPEVAFVAPGVDVRSTVPWGYDKLDGTSMACPHVTGLAALALGRLGGMTPEALRAALSRAASPLPKLTREQQGAGMIDAARLLGTAPTESFFVLEHPTGGSR